MTLEIQTGQADSRNGGGLPREFLSQLRHIRKAFEEEIMPEVRKRRYFAGHGKEHKRERASGRGLAVVRFSPFAMTLGCEPQIAQSPAFKNQSMPIRLASAPSQPSQIVSVFVIARAATDPSTYVLQKIQKKSAPGFPGGGIENGETILQTGIREFKEESNGGDPAGGIDIMPYNPVCIGTFVLNKATAGERGAVVLVELPEGEIANLQPGGGAEEGEVVEEIFFLTFDEILAKINEGTILPNAARIWKLYIDYLVSQ